MPTINKISEDTIEVIDQIEHRREFKKDELERMRERKVSQIQEIDALLSQFK